MLSCHFLCKKVTKELAKSKRANHAPHHKPCISAPGNAADMPKCKPFA